MRTVFKFNHNQRKIEGLYLYRKTGINVNTGKEK